MTKIITYFLLCSEFKSFYKKNYFKTTFNKFTFLVSIKIELFRFHRNNKFKKMFQKT